MSNNIMPTHNALQFASASGKTNVNFTPGEKALLAVCVIAEITAAIFMTLGFLNIFGPLESIGFYAAVGSGASIAGLTTIGFILMSILYCRARRTHLDHSATAPQTATNMASGYIDPATAANYIKALNGDNSYIANSDVTVVQ